LGPEWLDKPLREVLADMSEIHSATYSITFSDKDGPLASIIITNGKETTENVALLLDTLDDE
ncbi:hypothetical protein, partial [Vibrio harveyi]